MVWFFLIGMFVGLPIIMNLLNKPNELKELRIKEIEALTELERLKQENHLLENKEMKSELERIRKENAEYSKTKNSKWLIEETKVKEK